MLEGVLGSAAHPALLRQQDPQPARADMDARLLLQIGRESLRGPHVEGQAQRARRGLQRLLQGRQIGGICCDGTPGARRIGQGCHPTGGKAPQPVLHAGDRAATPAGNARHVIAQRRRFDHLQPLAHPPRQIRPLQLLFYLLTLLRRDVHLHRWPPGSSRRNVLLPLPPPAYLPSSQFSSTYLVENAPNALPRDNEDTKLLSIRERSRMTRQRTRNTRYLNTVPPWREHDVLD